MARIVDRVNAMKPDLVVVDGDLVDGNVHEVEPLLPVLKGLHAPLGVWAVTGNHEWYAGIDRSVHLLEDAGYTVLRDRWAEAAPGLVLAGVDDLTARRQFGQSDHPVEKALAGRPVRRNRAALALAPEGRRGRGVRRRPDALGPHPRRPDLAVPLPRAVRLPVARRALRGRWDVRDRLPRHRHLGPAHAALAPLRDRADYPTCGGSRVRSIRRGGLCGLPPLRTPQKCPRTPVAGGSRIPPRFAPDRPL